LVSAAQDPDVDLMLALQRGEDSAFDRLFEKHAAAVVRFARQFVRSNARAEELAQDVFLQVYKARSSYKPTARFNTWLYRIATNACLSEVRRPEHRLRVDAHPPAGERERPEQPLFDKPGPSSEDDLLSREAVDTIRTALDALPPQQRASLLLARVEGMSYEEVAETLSCSVSAVKSLVHRATVTLRSKLLPRGESS
jgi:RNA polymerase sigma-70 factor (ECF subfamily)